MSDTLKVALISLVGAVIVAMINNKDKWFPSDPMVIASPQALSSPMPVPTVPVPNPGPSAATKPGHDLATDAPADVDADDEPAPVPDEPAPPSPVADPPPAEKTDFADARVSAVADGADESGQVLVRNYCGQAVEIFILIHDAQGRPKVAQWHYEAGKVSRPGYDDLHLTSADGAARYYARTADYRLEWRGDDTYEQDNQVHPLRRVRLGRDDAGRYLLDLTCPG